MKDIEKAKQFYHDLFGLDVILDNVGNVILTEGLVLQDEKIWKPLFRNQKDFIPPRNMSISLWLTAGDRRRFDFMIWTAIWLRSGHQWGKFEDMEFGWVNLFGCIILMWLPFLVWKFSFRSVAEMIAYLCGNVLLLAMYYVLWIFCLEKKNHEKCNGSGCYTSRYFPAQRNPAWTFAIGFFAVLFGIAHTYISYVNCRKDWCH